MLRMARNAPTVEPMTATHVLKDTASGSRTVGGTGSSRSRAPVGVRATEATAMICSIPQRDGVDRAMASDAPAEAAQVAGEPATGLVSIEVSTDIPARRLPISG